MRILPSLSLLVFVLLLNGNKCQENEGACQAGTKCTPTVHTYMEKTARKLLTDEILPEHTSKLDKMFDDKLAAVESRFNEQLRLKDEKINQLSTKLDIMDEEIKVRKNTESNMIKK